MQIKLKKIVSHSNKNRVYLFLLFIFLIIYDFIGRISNEYGMELPLLEFEKDIPFLIWTIWIYAAIYGSYIIWCLYSYRDELEMQKVVYGFIFTVLISSIFFYFFPIIYPREGFPLPMNNDITTLIFQAVRSVDKPCNCFPSTHVGFSFLLAYGFIRQSKKRFYFAIFISLLISISTLTTKQHYIYDIVFGFLLSSLIYFFLGRFTILSTCSPKK
jgi:membrane-associated phospholipid phosphatase